MGWDRLGARQETGLNTLARDEYQDDAPGENDDLDLLLSAVSITEIAIKAAVGKLELANKHAADRSAGAHHRRTRTSSAG